MTDNPHGLPPHLIGMTQSIWDTYSRAERDRARDMSHCHATLLPYTTRTVALAETLALAEAQARTATVTAAQADAARILTAAGFDPAAVLGRAP